jgi:aminoglycoside 3-N-acetyltransferase
MNRETAPDRMCTRLELENAFIELGIKQGMILSVHASLNSLGFIPGGARSVVDALVSVLGPEGTLVMPAHCGDNSDPAYWRHPPVLEAWWPAIREAMPAFDRALSPARCMGAIADCFRAYPGVMRSDHPTSSFIARGPAAADLLARHDLDCCLGDASPNGALERADAWVLLIGVSFSSCTEMHLAEYRSNCRTHFRQGSSVLRGGCPEFVYYSEIELNSDDFHEPGRLMDEAGLVRHSRVSQAQLRLFRVRDAVRVATEWLAQNRLHQQDEQDREMILAYLRSEPEYNLFLIGDIENFGMATDFQDVMAFRKDGRTNSVLLRYHHGFIPYSQDKDFALPPLLAALDTPNLRFLSGKRTVMDRLKPYFPDYCWRTTYLMRLGKEGLAEAADMRPEPAGLVMRTATVEDIPQLVDFLTSIAEFARQGTREERIGQLEKGISIDRSHYYLYWHDGQVIASAGTAAENSLSAMVIAVATAPQWRGIGLASRLVDALSRDLLAERMQYLCLFYDNPAAGRIYRRLGFIDVGEWVMATPPDPMAKGDTTNVTRSAG